MGVIAIPDFGGASKDVATKVVSSVHFQNVDPPITVDHYVNDGTDSRVIVASAAYLRAVRVFNNSDRAVFVKFHNTASTPTIGVTAVVMAVGVQATLPNPDPRLSGGGRFFSAGIAMTLAHGLADNDTEAVGSGEVLIDVEYEQYT